MPFDMPISRDEPDREVLGQINAIEVLLQRDGWCQRTWKDYDGRRCLGQAILEVCKIRVVGRWRLLTFGWPRKPAILLIRRATFEVTGRKFKGVLALNEDGATTEETIFQVLRRAREILAADVVAHPAVKQKWRLLAKAGAAITPFVTAAF